DPGSGVPGRPRLETHRLLREVLFREHEADNEDVRGGERRGLGTEAVALPIRPVSHICGVWVRGASRPNRPGSCRLLLVVHQVRLDPEILVLRDFTPGAGPIEVAEGGQRGPAFMMSTQLRSRFEESSCRRKCSCGTRSSKARRLGPSE